MINPILPASHSSNSNLQITDQKSYAHVPKTFRNTSQINDLMKDFPSSRGASLQYQTKIYKDLITQQNRPIKIPKISNQNQGMLKQISNKVTAEHQNWLQNNKKFVKPYSECTRYIDNLSQHKALIRRGPFNIPVQKQKSFEKDKYSEVQKISNLGSIYSKQSTIQNQNSRIKAISYSLMSQNSYQEYKSVFRTKKQMIYKSLNNLKIQQETRSKISKSVNKFDKSVDSHSNNYKNLMKKQRYLTQEDVILRNSVNKIVAVDLIKQKLLASSPQIINNLHKIKKKFKKKQNISVPSDN